MDFDYSPNTKELQARLLAFIDTHIYPNEKPTREIEANTAAGKRWTPCKPLKNSNPTPKKPDCGTCGCRAIPLRSPVLAATPFVVQA